MGLSLSLVPCSAAVGATSSSIVAAANAQIVANRGRTGRTDRIAIVDYGKPSWAKRFHAVDLAGERVESFRVAHGRGSDPAHTGWLKSFSNEVGSKASSAGAYRVLEVYSGKYGRALRLEGLDPENSNAVRRAIVLHAAWYAEPDVLTRIGKLGRSEGCFAFSEADRDHLLDWLTPGSLIIAGKLGDSI
jgi:hypothetical protein